MIMWHQMIPKILTASRGGVILKMNQMTEKKWQESKDEVQTYLARLKYAIQCGSVKLNFQKDRNADHVRDKKYTNRYTMGQLFPLL